MRRVYKNRVRSASAEKIRQDRKIWEWCDDSGNFTYRHLSGMFNYSEPQRGALGQPRATPWVQASNDVKSPEGAR